MADREKVIKGLECCLAVNECKICPYIGNDSWCGNNDQLLSDALELLKAQEPRVMTLEEAKSAWVIEYRSGNMREVGASLLDIDIDPTNAYYGVIYRNWTSRPTDEQREKVKWK